MGSILGGAETYVLSLAKKLPDNIKVHLITGNGQLTKEFQTLITNKNIPYLLYPFLSRYSNLMLPLNYSPFNRFSPFDVEAFCVLLSIIKIKRFLKDVEILEVHSPLEGLIFPFTPNTKNIINFHGPWVGPIYNKLKKIINRHCDLFITCSNYSKCELQKVLPPDIPIEVFYNGVDTDIFTPKNKLPFTPDIPYNKNLFKVGTLARLSRDKGTHLLAEAAKELEGIVEFFIAGPAETGFQAELERYGKQKNVHLLGPIDHQSTPGFYRFLDTFVLPSKFETFSITALEAMASGVPVIATKVGGMVEMIKDNDSGYLIPPDNVNAIVATLKELAGNSQRRQDFSVAARTRVELCFSLEKTASCATKLYEGLQNT